MSKPRNNSFVVFDKKSCSKADYNKYFKKTFDGKLFIYLGEVKNAPGHCILTNLDDGKIIGIYHIDNFREANEEEV